MKQPSIRRILPTSHGFYVPLLGILILPLLLLCGLAVDAGNLYIMQLRLQRAVDAGGMRAIPHLIENRLSDAKLFAENTTRANIAAFGIDPHDPGVLVNATIQGNSRVRVSAQIPATLYLMNHLAPTFSDRVPVAATAVAGRPKMLISLVLDLTGSMIDRAGERNEDCEGEDPDPARCKYKIHALRDAALTFFDSLQGKYDGFSLIVYSATRNNGSAPEDAGARLLVDFDGTAAEIRAAIEKFGLRRSTPPCDDYWKSHRCDGPGPYLPGAGACCIRIDAEGKCVENTSQWCFMNTADDGLAPDGTHYEPPQGATGIAHGIRQAVSHFDAYLARHGDAREYKKHMVVMTDGIPNIWDGAMSCYGACDWGAPLSPTCGNHRPNVTLPPLGHSADDPDDPWFNYSSYWGTPEAITTTRTAADIARRKGITVHGVGFGFNTSPDGTPCPDPLPNQFAVSCHKANGLIPNLIRRIANQMVPGDAEYTNATGFTVAAPGTCEVLWREYQQTFDAWLLDECPEHPTITTCEDILTGRNKIYSTWLNEGCACEPTVDSTGPKLPAGVAVTAESIDDLRSAFEKVRDAIFTESRLIE